MPLPKVLPIPTLVVLLGGQTIINREIRHDFDLIEIAKQGLPKQALDALALQISFSTKEMAEPERLRLVSEVLVWLFQSSQNHV